MAESCEMRDREIVCKPLDGIPFLFYFCSAVAIKKGRKYKNDLFEVVLHEFHNEIEMLEIVNVILRSELRENLNDLNQIMFERFQIFCSHLGALEKAKWRTRAVLFSLLLYYAVLDLEIIYVNLDSMPQLPTSLVLPSL